MAIRSIVSEIIKEQDATTIRVTYTDDASFKTQKEYRIKVFDLNNFKSLVRSEIAGFSQVQNVDKLISVGDFDPSIPPPQLPPDPTPQELARTKFFKDLGLQRQMETAIKFGFKTTGDSDYTDQVALVKSEFLQSYVPYLGIS